MKSFGQAVLAALLLLGLAGCGQQQSAAEQTQKPKKVLGPAVAGMFYPRHETDLAKAVDKLLAEAKTERVENLRALVCPHAGYEFSGPIAAVAYKQLADRNLHTIIIMGPSHTARFQGAALADADVVENPLGQIPVSAKAAELAKLPPFVVDPKCEVQRPAFWQSSPKELPPFGKETPHTWEHSVEVQYPFLQRMLKNFEVVPVVFGEVEPEDVADALLKVLDDETLLVASSDLTHYLPYDTAKSLDTHTVEMICSLNTAWLEEEDAGLMAQAGVSLACGKCPILTVMHVAKKKGWKAKLLDYRNSGDTAGEKARVVGYSAIAFYAPAGAAAEKPARGETGEGDSPIFSSRKSGQSPAAAQSPVSKQNEFSAAERKFLLELARKGVAAAAAGDNLPQPEAKDLAGQFAQLRACFVTLKENGQLRGCVGSIFPREPLCQAILHAARSAAVEDHRFPPVKPEELKQIHVEVSVLTLPERLKYRSPEELLAKLRPGIDGVVLRVGSHQGLFLPQVWEQLPDKVQFLNRLTEEKAGLEAASWKRPDARILVYQVEAFEEPKP